MKNLNKITVLALILFLILGMSAHADVAAKYKINKKDKEQATNLIQKTYTTVYDNQKNTVSNFQFFTSNYGIFALDIANNIGGGFWPRGSGNQYLFGGGIWFAAKKQKPGTTDPDSMKKLVTISYNPNSGGSWFVPGRIEDGDLIVDDDIYTYRTCFSIDFKRDGTPLLAKDKYSWPVWDISADDTLKKDRYFGRYVKDDALRTVSQYTKGPAYISGEDIFATYKDTDLRRYEGGTSKMKNEGYPLRLQIEQTIYSWGFGDYRDFVFLRYEITNKSDQLLKECWLAPVMDADIAVSTNASGGAANDRVKFYESDPSLNLAFQWSNGDRGERNLGFGYLGFDFLESPAVDVFGFPRKDKKYYTTSEQLGLVTFRNWPIDQDLKESEERYNFISSRRRDGESDAGDQRFMMATGPFNMNPGDTVRVVVGIILANTAKGSDADGTDADVAELVRKDKFAQQVYDNNFQAPVPPDRSVIKFANPLNHGAQFQWDETSESSYDIYEKGLDFLGFKIYRARRPNLDTFDLNIITGNNDYPNGKGPFGWKQLFTVELPKPFRKSINRAGLNDNNLLMPMIDSLRILGPYVDAQGKVIDSMAVRVMRIANGVNTMTELAVFQQTKTSYPFVAGIDTSIYSQPWGPIYKKMLEEDGIDLANGAITWDPNRKVKLFDSVMVGVAYFNRALVPYNPLFYRRNTIEINRTYLYDSVLSKFPDGIKGKTYAIEVDTVKHTWDTIRATIDTIFKVSTLRPSIIGGKTGYVIDILTNRSLAQQMTDTLHSKEVLDSLYSFIKKGQVKVEFPDWEQSQRAYKEAIIPYMTEQTKNRLFVDIGDDNKDGKINRETDPTKSEELVNNINYYYKVLAYDEGDYTQPTPSKSNDGFDGLSNFTIIKPSAGVVSNDPEIQVIISPEDSLKMGGLYNFRAYAIDRDRLLKNFAGHDLELTIDPYWSQNQLNIRNSTSTSDYLKFGLYQRRAQLKDLNTGTTLFDAVLSFEQQPCYYPWRGLFTEDAASMVLADSAIADPVSGKTVTFGEMGNKEIRNFLGTFSTGSFREADPAACYTLQTLSPAYGALGFGFDFALQQFGGRFRPDSLSITASKTQGEDAVTPVNIVDDYDKVRTFNRIMVTQPVGIDYSVSAGYFVNGSFNNGPGVYEVEFTTGGKDTLELNWGGKPPKNTNVKKFIVDYLNVKIKNITSFKRPSETGLDSVTVHYPSDVPPMYIPNNGKTPFFDADFPQRVYPDPRNLGYGGVDRLNPKTNEFIGKYNIGVYAWIDARGPNYNNALSVPKQMARANYHPYDTTDVTYIDRQNRYYLSGTSIDGQNTIDFTHDLNIGGCQFAIDYANKGRFNTSSTLWSFLQTDTYNFGPDFAVGDKITLRTTGGALGLPMPGTKVIFRVNNPEGNNGKFTDDILDKIKVVPNPYFISQQGQKSPYDDNKIFFTRLPHECKIDIYTVNGDLVKTLDHKDVSSDLSATEYLEPWDLISANGMRIQSQAFVAVITTPDGAKTIKNFSVVVGGFRLIQN